MATNPAPPAPGPSAAPQPEQKMSAIARIFGVFFGPKAVFQDVARKPGWVAPVLFMTVISLGMHVVLAQRLNWDDVAQQQIAKSEMASRRMESLPPEQRAQSIHMQAMAQKYTQYATGVIGTILLTLILAAVYLGVFNIMAGAGFRFGLAMSVVAYGMLPISIKELLGIVIGLVKDPSAINNPQNFVLSNPGAMMGNDVALWKMAAASTLDIFVIWAVILTGIGFAAANPRKLTVGRAVTYTFSVYIFFSLIGLGIAAAFS